MKELLNVKLLFILLAGIIIASCSKNQKVVNDLEGTWKITHLVRNDTVVPQSEYEHTLYKFEKCKVKKEDCPGTITDDQGGSLQIAFTYTISDNGKTITYKYNLFGVTTSSTGTITERSNSKMVVEEMQDANGDHSITTFEKE